MVLVQSDNEPLFIRPISVKSPGPGPSPPGPGPGPEDDDPVVIDVPNKFNVGKLAHATAPDSNTAQVANIYREAAEHLYKAPLKAIIPVGEPEAQTDKNLLFYTRRNIPANWQPWADAVHSRMWEYPDRTRKDWFDMFNEVADALDVK